MVQIFRALAIIAVVMIHTTPEGEWQVFCRPFINFSVATFLFLSGYLTKIENDNWLDFYKKRVFRVIIPYIIWSVLYSMPTVLHSGIKCIFINLLTAKASGPLYYIFVYIQFVLLTPLLGKLAKSKYQYIGWIIAPVSILIFKYYYLISGVVPNDYVSIIWSDLCLGWFTFYYLGLILGNKIIEKDFSIRKLSLLYIVSIFIQMAEGYGWYLLGDVNCGTQAKLSSLLTSTLFLLLIYAILQKGTINIKSNILRLLGDYSFGIYLCHIMVKIIMNKIPYYSLVPYPITSIIVVIISLLCCYCGYKIFGEKISTWLGLR